MWSEPQLQVARNLIAIANKYGTIPSILMLAVCIQESTLNELANNLADSPQYGGSWGPFQLNQDIQAHPNTKYMAINPWYDYGYHEIQQRWESAYRTLGGWRSFCFDSVSFLSRFAPQAQGSVAWSITLAQARLDDAFNVMEQL